MTHSSPHLPSLLEGLALEWFKDQPTSLISCSEEIKLAFLGACSFYKDMNNKFDHLYEIHLREGKRLSSHYKFMATKIHIKIASKAFKKGLPTYHLLYGYGPKHASRLTESREIHKMSNLKSPKGRKLSQEGSKMI